jgi:hypothetical protein
MAMTDLREELDAVLRTVHPGEAPVGAAMRQGRCLRLRRRAAAAASAAAVAIAVAAGYPALSPKSAAPIPMGPSRIMKISVTPGPGGPSGVIALGTIGGTRWSVSISDSYAGGCISGTVGAEDIATGCYQSGTLFPVVSEGPLILQGSSNGDYVVAAGGVAAGVRYVVLTLTDGQQLKLIPVALGGHRYIAFATPAAVQVTKGTAYLGNGQELTAIPFDPPGFGIPWFGRWTSPGQREPQPVTAVVGSGRTDGKAWSVTAFIGPWGTCLQGNVAGNPNAGAACWPSAQMTSTELDTTLGDRLNYGPYRPLIVVGSAASAVTEVKVTLTNGTSVRVPARAAGREKFWVLALGPRQSVRGWTAYDAAGKQVASGSASS